MTDKDEANQLLLKSAKAGDIGGIRSAMAAGAFDLNLALNAAVSNAHIDTFNYLLSLGADVDLALGAAVSSAQVDTVKYLLEAGADPNGLEGWFVWKSITTHNIGILKTLVEAGADIRVNNDAFLELTVEEGFLEGAAYLIEKGASVNVRQSALLSKAIGWDQSDVALLLLEKGANPNDGIGGVPLRVACYGTHLELIQALIEKGAMISDEAITNAVSTARRTDNWEIVRYLEEMGGERVRKLVSQHTQS